MNLSHRFAFLLLFSFLLRGDAHLNQQREPARLIVVQSVFRRSVHLVLFVCDCMYLFCRAGRSPWSTR